MAKDPAVLWYWNDWNGGTCTMSRFLKGCYMDLLHAQFNNGNLSLDEIKTILGSDFGSSWSTLQKKFKQDDKGLFFNERLVFESNKRKKFSSSRQENLKGSLHMVYHMENENEIKIEFRNVFRKWIDYKKERKESYKSEKTLKICYEKLVKISNDDPEVADQIIMSAISNNYSGFFELKEDKKKQSKTESILSTHNEAIKNLEEKYGIS